MNIFEEITTFLGWANREDIMPTIRQSNKNQYCYA